MNYKLITIPVVVGSVLESPYPILVSISGIEPAAVLVAKATNRIPGSPPLYGGAVVDWEGSRGGIRIKHISGLDVNQKYDITLLVVGDNR